MNNLEVYKNLKASIIQEHRRTTSSIPKRGRWCGESSLMRYQKANHQSNKPQPTPLFKSDTSHVVYFDQRLSAAHPKCWSKLSFSAFFVLKCKKMQKSSKFWLKLSKKNRCFELAPKPWSSVLYWSNDFIWSINDLLNCCKMCLLGSVSLYFMIRYKLTC